MFQWNSKGYEIAEKFTNKFEMISPVWLQIKRSPDGTYKISGDHDIDSNWMQRLKKNNPAIKSNKITFTPTFHAMSILSFSLVVPRILFDDWKGQDFVTVLKSEADQMRIGKLFVSTCQVNVKNPGSSILLKISC
jgi:CRISPR/Cas system endoribonuclease Cas6 (RAMP superfamily)